MVILKIFNVDKNGKEPPLCELKIGEHVVGRGTFFNSKDKQISRRHIIINVTDDGATLTLVHITPIFYKSLNNPNIQILKKDESITVFDGDRFAFLIDTWYTLKIEDIKNQVDELVGCSATESFTFNPITSNTSVATSSSTKLSESTLSCKRSLELSYSEERKKLKIKNESLEKLKTNIDNIVAQDFTECDDNQENNKKLVDVSTTGVVKEEAISDSDDDSNVEMLPEVTQDIEIVSCSRVNSNEVSNSCNDAKDKDNDNNESSTTKTEEDITVKTEPVELKVKQENNEEATENDESTGGDCDDNKNGDDSTASPAEKRSETVQNPPTSASNSGANNIRREQCWYGQNCYRKNDTHKREFSHPGDSDYSQPSDDGKPPCAYGAQCFRSNPQHRKDYSHPTSRPAPKPSTSKQGIVKIFNLVRTSCPFCSHCKNRNFDDDDDQNHRRNGGGNGDTSV